MLIPYLCRIFYLSAGIMAILFESLPSLRATFIYYGKVKTTSIDREISKKSPTVVPKTSSSGLNLGSTKSSQQDSNSSDTTAATKSFLEKTVSKNNFVYFYIFGTMVSCLLLLQLIRWEDRKELYDFTIEADPWFFSLWKTLECSWSPLKTRYRIVIASNNIELCEPFIESISKVNVFALGLYTIHVFFRLIETAQWQPVSKAEIHLGHFAVGLVFYIFTPFAIFVDSIYAGGPTPSTSAPIVAIATVMFIYSVYTRYQCHRTLFNLKRLSREGSSSLAITQDGQYSIPMGGWFNLVSSPHYTMEILMYFSLYLITGVSSITYTSLLFWVIINLTISATETHRWYNRTFKSKYPRNRYAIFPYVW